MEDYMVYAKKQAEAGLKYASSILSTSAAGGFNFYTIGKPCRFNYATDPGNRVNHYLQSKMGIIDIVPCEITLDLQKAVAEYNKKGTDIRSILHHVGYKKKIKQFQEICNSYGLGNYSGIRIYTTEDTTSNESIESEYNENFFQKYLNQIQGLGKTVREIGRSVTSEADSVINTLVEKGVDAAASASKGLVSGDTATAVSSITKKVGKIILGGKRVSLPKIWSDTTYSSTLSCNVKLVSPYGHPEAIKEFIIKPIMILRILASPKTSDGVSYSGDMPFTVKAFGLLHHKIAHIKSINFARGGSDGSFNLYRQPLSVNVIITFESLIGGNAVYDMKQNENPEKDIFKKSHEFITSGNVAYQPSSVMLPTLNSVVESLKPVGILKHTSDKCPEKEKTITGGTAGVAAISPAAIVPLSTTNATVKSANNTVQKQSVTKATSSNCTNLDGLIGGILK